MFRKAGLGLFLLVIGFAAAAQNLDSLTFVKAKWEKRRIASRVKLYQHHFLDTSLFAANEHIAYVEVKRNKGVFAVAAEPQTLVTTSAFGLRENALVALNGNFFDVKNGGSVDYVRVDSKVVNENRLEKEGKRARHQQAALLVKDRKLSLHKWDGSADWEKNLSGEDVMLNGPLLLWNGIIEQLDTTSFTRMRHPRTCLGFKPNGNVVLLTVDGRHEQSAGMSLPELEKIMRWLGCESALNFDGGGSTTLWVKDFGRNGVVNYPSDNKKWDHEGERKVANVLIVRKK